MKPWIAWWGLASACGATAMWACIPNTRMAVGAAAFLMFVGCMLAAFASTKRGDE